MLLTYLAIGTFPINNGHQTIECGQLPSRMARLAQKSYCGGLAVECTLVTGVHACRPNMDNCRRGRADLVLVIVEPRRPQSAIRVTTPAYAYDDFHDALEGVSHTAACTMQIVSARFCSNRSVLAITHFNTCRSLGRAVWQRLFTEEGR